MRYKLLLAVFIPLLLLMGSAQAYFISPNVTFSPSSANVTYFLRNYISNETVLHPDKIYLDGTWVVMHTDNGTVNATVDKINSTFQEFLLQNDTSNINLSVNTSGWTVSGTVESYSNDSATTNTTVNASGWVNTVFRNVTDSTTTKFTLILVATIPIPTYFRIPSGLMIEENNVRFNIETGKVEVYIVI